VPLFASFVFRLQTRYRAELQEDPSYSTYRAEQAQQEGFRPENLPAPGGTQPFAETDSPEDLEHIHKETYERQRGLFVVHTWRPSTRRGQVADITVRLHEHGKKWTPISDGEVERVDYYLGRSFFRRTGRLEDRPRRLIPPRRLGLGYHRLCSACLLHRRHYRGHRSLPRLHVVARSTRRPHLRSLARENLPARTRST
jgi:hypothetical protein